MQYTLFKRAGFTVVELATVIVIIGILTAITTVGYRAYREDVNVSTMKRDMAEIKLGLEKYYAKNGSYPATGTTADPGTVWNYRRQAGENFIPGLVPEYIRTISDVPFGSTTSATSNTYIYRSNGAEYKLLRLGESGVTFFQPFEIAAIEAELQDPGPPSTPRWSATTKRGWGYWTPGAASW